MSIERIMEKISELWGWAVIVLSFVGLSVGGAWIIMYLMGGTAGKVIGAIVGLVVIGLDVITATKSYKNKGTVYTLSRIRATPELDDNPDEQNTRR